MDMNKIEEIFEEIKEERERQDKKWGEQDHHPIVWDSILGEEAGEVSKAALEHYFENYGDLAIHDYRAELIQTAAVAVAAIESVDRNELNNETETITYNNKEWTRWNTSDPDGYPDSETGQLYDVLTDEGNVYRGYQMDWGFVPKNESDRTVQEEGEEIKYYREVKENE